MPSTRTAAEGTPLRQERWASSSKIPQGIRGNLVARRCQTLPSAEDRRIVFFLQEVSIRDGLNVHRTCNLFPSWPWPTVGAASESALHRVARELETFFPDAFQGKCLRGPRLAAALERHCLDASFHLSQLKGGAALIHALTRYREKFESRVGRPVALTTITNTIWEAIDYALTCRGIALIEGAYRSGKSYSAQAWALRHLGQCRYVSLSSAPDDKAFYVSIAHSLGVATATSYKAMQIRERVVECLRQQQLLLILDEADYLWTQTDRPKSPPERINWLMTSVVNAGVPVVLLASANFSRAMKLAERCCTSWGSEQFHGRLRLRRQLPALLEEQDLLAMAQVLMPDATNAARLLAVGSALRSRGYLGALETVAARAGFFAAQETGRIELANVEAAIEEAFGPAVESPILKRPVARARRDLAAKPPPSPRGDPARA